MWNTPPNSWGDVFTCSYQFIAETATSSYSLDFNRDGDYLDYKESTNNVASSLLGNEFGFIKLSIQGDASALSSNVSDFMINGINMGNFSSDEEEGLSIVFTSENAVFSRY